MTPQAALSDLLARVGARNGAAVLISTEELGQWPARAVAAMKAQKLLTKARSAGTVVCPGCEQQCVMPVHTPVAAGGRVAASFVVCDKRTDINRVPVAPERITQWRCDGGALCGFITASLGLQRSAEHSAGAGMFEIGVASGHRRRQILCLRANGELALIAGSSSVPLGDVVGFRNGAYFVDEATIRQLVDSATTADPRYTPSNARREARKLGTQAMYASWQKAYRESKRRRRHQSDVWHARQIAKLPIANSRSPETIRKHMKQ